MMTLPGAALPDVPQRIARLPGQHVRRGARLIFAARVADADERDQAMLHRGGDLLRHRLVRLAEMGAALAVAEFDEGRPAVLHHQGRDFARPGALVGPVHVLRADLHPRARENAPPPRRYRERAE